MEKVNLYTYIKDFVDSKISIDTSGIDDHKYDKVIDLFNEEIIKVNDKDFIIILLNPFIPDTYRTNGTKEKLFTKLIEVLFSDWCRRMGLKSTTIKQKSNIEDVRFFFGKKAILTDSKTFRLGRSQKAPNHKDFLKLSSVEHWIQNFNEDPKNLGLEAVGGMVTYTNQHEWEKGSEVYSMCSDKNTPTLMLPYTYLALLLEFKNSTQDFNVNKLLSLWDYNRIFPSTVSTRQEYWNVINKELESILGISKIDIDKKLELYEKIISDFIIFTISLLNQEKNTVKDKITNEVNGMLDISKIKEELINYKISNETDFIETIITRIGKFR